MKVIVSKTNLNEARQNKARIAVTVGRAVAQFQAVQRAFAGQRLRARLCFARHQSQQGILAQSLVVIQIFVTQRQPVDSLPHHLLHAVLDQPRIPAVPETLAEARKQIHLGVGFLQQQPTSVRADRPATELRHDLPAAAHAGKPKPILDTLCHIKAVSLLVQNVS